jgi:Tol biopolymer transport system component
MRSYPLRRLAIALFPALIWANLSALPAHPVRAAPYRDAIFAAIAASRGNILLGEVLTIDSGSAHVLLKRSPVAFQTLALSPDHRRIAALGCCSPASAGIWILHRDGTHLHRVVRPPLSPCGNPLAISSVVWSPGGHRLAYVVYIPSDAFGACPPGAHDATGVWVTQYDHPRPRMVDSEKFVFSGPPLSWSPDGRTLAVSGGRGGIRSVDVATGASRILVSGYAGIYAPVTGALAYVTSGPRPGQPTRIWIAGAQGRHQRILVISKVGLAESPLVWSPDGRSIAYITDTGSVFRRGARTLAVVGAVAPHPRTLVAVRDGAVDSPTWSPDGTSIAYSGSAQCACPHASPPGMGPAIFSIDVRTGAQRLLATPQQLLTGLRSSAQVTSIIWAGR